MVSFPGGSEVKASACSAGDLGWIPGSGRCPGGEPTPAFLPGESHGRWSLVGYSRIRLSDLSYINYEFHLRIMSMQYITGLRNYAAPTIPLVQGSLIERIQGHSAQGNHTVASQ